MNINQIIENIVFWITGALNIFTLMMWLRTRQQNNKLSQDLTSANETISSLEQKVYNQDFRYAVWRWNGWHQQKNPSNKWHITVRLKEVEKSLTKPSFHRFEIVSFVTSEPKANQDVNFYRDYFKKNYDGGWLDVNSTPGFHWVTSLDPAVERQKKLDKII